MRNFTNTDDVIDMRDVIARFEELENEFNEWKDAETSDEDVKDKLAITDWALGHEEGDEIAELQVLIEECKGKGGDEHWRGDWYPVTLIHESAFEEQMDQMIEECYELPKDLPFWMTISYDYDALKMDYTSVDFAGETYLIR